MEGGGGVLILRLNFKIVSRGFVPFLLVLGIYKLFQKKKKRGGGGGSDDPSDPSLPTPVISHHCFCVIQEPNDGDYKTL